MNKIEKKYLLLLRIFLLSAAVAWGVSVLGLVLPWSVVERELCELGAQSSIDIIVQYWLKMAAFVYTLMACFFVMTAIRPIKYLPVIGLIGIGHILLGIVVMINGLILGIEAVPLYVDVGFCFFVGLGIVVTNNKLQEYSVSEEST